MLPVGLTSMENRIIQASLKLFNYSFNVKLYKLDRNSELKLELVEYYYFVVLHCHVVIMCGKAVCSG